MTTLLLYARLQIHQEIIHLSQLAFPHYQETSLLTLIGVCKGDFHLISEMVCRSLFSEKSTTGVVIIQPDHMTNVWNEC